MANPFHSPRLIYRAAEPTSEDDQAFFLAIQSDALAYQTANISIHKPQGKSSAQHYLKFLAEETLIGVVICLPAPDATSKPIPIGAIHLDQAKPDFAHHRRAELGINIVSAYQGQGYGSEAIRWMLRWAFRTAGLHRVGLRACEYNEGALKLYERLGFVREGCEREALWFDGRWWDGLAFGMLASEWTEMEERQAGK